MDFITRVNCDRFNFYKQYIYPLCFLKIGSVENLLNTPFDTLNYLSKTVGDDDNLSLFTALR